MRIVKDTKLFENGNWTILDNFYEEGGELFDFLFAMEKKDDIPLYLKFAGITGGNILEVACGSGRVLLPLVKEGFNVFGFDNSKKMIEIAHKRIHKEKKMNNAHLFLGDMADFYLKKKFNMAFIAYNTFNHILNDREQINSLIAIRECLVSGGTFIMEVIHDRKFTYNGIVYRRTKYNDKLNIKIEAYSSTEYDHLKDIEKVSWYYIVKEKRTIKRLLKSVFLRKVIKMTDIHTMLQACNFENISLYGSYDLIKDKEEKRIFIANKV